MTHDDALFRCRQCGHPVNDNQRTCNICGVLQPYYGFRISAEGGKPPINGYAIVGFAVSCGSWVISLMGLTALLGLIFSIIGFIDVKRKGQGGELLSILGIVISAVRLVLKLLMTGFVVWLVSLF